MRCKLAFSLASDDRLLLTMEAHRESSSGQREHFLIVPLEDENTFLYTLVLLDLDQQATVAIISGMLLAASGRHSTERWLPVTLTELQLRTLGFAAPEIHDDVQKTKSPFGFSDPQDIHRVFLQSPLAILMLGGPEHTISFINESYVQLLGRNSRASLLDKPIREALPELEGQPFFGLLDRVYRTGEPYIGLEMPARIYHEGSQSLQENYYDFVYYPVRDKQREVCGILCQATNVTERVLDKHVRESREAQLYRQWAELNAVYRDSPLAMSLIDAKDLTILRLNEKKAKRLGHPAEELLGKKITALNPHLPFLEDVYLQVIRSKAAHTFEVLTGLEHEHAKPQKVLWNVNPVLDASGTVEAIASTVIDITEWPETLTSEVAAASSATR